METIYLYRPNDLHSEYLSPSGAVWAQMMCEPDIESYCVCDICEKPIEAYDWLCLDGGESVCSDHVEIIPAFLGERLTAEFSESIASQNRLVRMRCTVGTYLTESIGAVHMPNRYLGWICHPSQVDALRNDYRAGHPRTSD